VAGLEKLLAHERNAQIVWAHGGSDFSGNMTPALIGRLMDAHPNLFMSLRPVPPKVQTNPFGLKFHNLMFTPTAIEPAWLALLKRHSSRFLMGADAFVLSSSVPRGKVQRGKPTAGHAADGYRKKNCGRECCPSVQTLRKATSPRRP
jgi:hypothetical protein